jgi:hypothetical protein
MVAIPEDEHVAAVVVTMGITGKELSITLRMKVEPTQAPKLGEMV